MKTYTAHVKPGRPPILLREGWSWGAAILGGLWLVRNRAWIPAVLQIVAIVLALALAPRPLRAPLLLGLVVVTGLMGRDMVRWSLARRGYALAHVVAARDGDRAVGRLLAARPDLASDLAGLPPMMRVAVVDYGSGNLASAARALVVAAEREGVPAAVAITADPDAVAAADRVVLPGQGAFRDCATGLAAVPGMREAIEASVRAGRPFLGICVGMQLMAQRGLEHEETPGFGWIAGEVAEMAAPGLRLPQMGWNALQFAPGSHPLLQGLQPGDHTYFVHSYALRGGTPDEILATTDYGGAVPALVARGNRAGTQFHVEKSQGVGLRILANFLRWTPG